MDLRQHPDHAPLRATYRLGPWEVLLHSEPRLPGEPTREPFLVWAHGGRLRLAVTDPSHTAPHVASDDAAAGGAQVVAALTWEDSPIAAFEEANSTLHAPGLRPHLGNVTVSAASVDVDVATGAVFALQAGDVEAWVRTTTWSRLFPSERLASGARAAFEAHPGSASPSHPLHYRAHVDTLDDPSAWVSAPLGLFPVPLLQSASQDAVTELVVASDGARLDPDRLEDLAGWLEEIQVAPDGHPHPSPHGDLTVLHARRVG